LLLFAPKTDFLSKSSLFFWQSMGTQNANCTHFNLTLWRQKTKIHYKKFVIMADRAVFVCAISLLFTLKTALLILFLKCIGTTLNSNFTHLYLFSKPQKTN
jgi:hypothetical protein